MIATELAMNSLTRLLLVLSALAAVVCVVGCSDQQAEVQADDPQMAAYVDLVLPARIEIQRYLTKPVSFQGDGNADGLELILAAYDATDDLTKVVGKFHVELLTRKPGDSIGERIGFWPVEIDTEKELRRYRDELSRYYQLPLQLQQRPLPAGDYVLQVWLFLPGDKRLFDEYEFSYDGKGAPPARLL
jgi:hypothetical protein